jgi:uncharacterized protein YbcV (DUF1398 family)
MFTIEQIKVAHDKMKSGADFPKYIAEIKEIGVVALEMWVKDRRTVFFGLNNFQTKSKTAHETLALATVTDKDKFVHYLKKHQKGKTDFFTFCQHCAATGIEKWNVDFYTMTCTYFDKDKKEILVEIVPS